MTVIERYNNLNGTVVSRSALKQLLYSAKQEKENRVVDKLKKLLEHNHEKEFEITISKPLLEQKAVIKKTKKKKLARSVKRVSNKKPKLVITGMSIPKVNLEPKKSIIQEQTKNPSTVKRTPVRSVTKQKTKAPT